MTNPTTARRGHCRTAALSATLFAAVATTALTTGAHDAAAAPEPVTIVSYDIEQTPRPGWGCWTHTYDGTVADTGRTVSGSVVCTPDGNRIADYTGGSGTLNDGDLSAAHLLVMRNDDSGQPIRPAVTLHFAEPVIVERVTVHGGNTAFAGGIDSATVGVGNTTANIAATPAGPPNPLGQPSDDVFDLTTTDLGAVATTELALSEFATSFFGAPFDQLAIAEITIEGRAAAVPVDIDIRPATARNVINPRSVVPLPIAVLSSESLDIATIETVSLTFGRTGSEHSILGCTSFLDLNRDRRPDLLCLFAPRRAGFVVGDTVGLLRGRTVTGLAIEGTDAVIVR